MPDNMTKTGISIDNTDIDRLKDAKDETEVVDKVTSDFLAVYNRWEPCYRRMINSYNGVIGEHGEYLSKEGREELAKERRPNEVFNLLLPTINTVSGMVSANKLAIKANPIKRGDEQGALFRTVLVSDYAMGLCGGYEEAAKSHVDAAICGRGVTNNYYSTDLRRWVTESFDPFMVMDDPDAPSGQESKERYKFVSAYYSVEELLNIYDLDPEIADAIRTMAKSMEGTKQSPYNSAWLQKIYGGAADMLSQKQYKNLVYTLLNSMVDLTNGIYRIIEFHDRRQVELGYLFHPQSGEVFSVPDKVSSDKQKKSELLQTYSKEQGWIYGTDKKDEIWTIAVCPTLSPSKCLINKKHPIQGQGFQYKTTAWYSYHPDKTQVRGVLDNILGINDYYSKAMNTRLDAILRGIRPNIDVVEGALDADQLEAYKNGEIGQVRLRKPGFPKPEREQIMPEVISALNGFSNEVLELKDILTGIPKALQGFQESSKETGVLYRQKITMGGIMMETPNAHIRRNMIDTFNYCSEGLRVFMTLPEEVRILAEPPKGLDGVEMDQTTKGAYWLKVNWKEANKILNDVTAGQYDFRADTTQLGQMGKMAQEAAALQYMDLILKTDATAAKAALPMILEQSDLPVGKEIAAIIKPIIDAELGLQQNAAQKKVIGSDMALAGQAKQLMQPTPQQMAQQQPQEAAQPQQ